MTRKKGVSTELWVDEAVSWQRRIQRTHKCYARMVVTSATTMQAMQVRVELWDMVEGKPHTCRAKSAAEYPNSSAQGWASFLLMLMYDCELRFEEWLARLAAGHEF